LGRNIAGRELQVLPLSFYSDQNNNNGEKLAKANRFVALQTIIVTRYDTDAEDWANLK